MPETEMVPANRLADVEAQDDPEEDEETKLWRNMERTIVTRIVQGTAGASIVLNLVAMIVTRGITILMGIVALVVGSAVIYYQFMIQDTDTLRTVQNDLRHKVNDFADLNVKLKNNNARLAAELVPLKETEKKLEAIAKKSGSDTNKLRQVVKENQKIIDAKKLLIKEDVIQDMMEVVLESERDSDGTFSDTELKRLMLRLKNLPAIEMDQEKFMERAKMHRTISDVFAVMKTIYDDLPEDERIFTISETPEDLA